MPTKITVFLTLMLALLITGCQSLQFGGSPIPVTATQTASNQILPTSPKPIGDIPSNDF